MTNNLIIKIENTKPIETKQFVLFLDSIYSQYEIFLRKEFEYNFLPKERKLYIAKIESGSLLVEIMPAIMPLLDSFDAIKQFYIHTKNILSALREEKSEEVPYNLTKKDCKDWSNAMAIIAQNEGSKMSIGDFKVFKTNNYYTINYSDANIIQNNANKYSEQTLANINQYYKKLMRWERAGFSEKTNDKIIDRVIIEGISPVSKKVIFENEKDKYLVTTHNPNFPDNNWQDLGYIVDVEVEFVEDIPKLYKITKVYAEDTFIL